MYRMGARIIDHRGEIDEVRFSLPNSHHFLVDLKPFGLENDTADGAVYFAADRPYGLIEATVLRDGCEARIPADLTTPERTGTSAYPERTAMAADRRTVIENCAIATVDAQDTEYASGHVVLTGNRIESLGAGAAPAGLENVVRRIDGTGHLATPGLVNTHHHFYQWITRGLATDHHLFDWLVAPLPDVGAHRRADGARGGPGLPRDDGPRRRHHRHGPPLRLPAGRRRPVRRRHRRRP
ncbi:hypothetical protein GCM10023238_10770 [Streptomyces heliomycini]